MKNIIFSDRYGLTEAVLNGTKVNTRREEFKTDANLAGECLFTKKGLTYKRFDFDNGQSFTSRYAIGEVLAVAQSYKDIAEQWHTYYDDDLGFEYIDRAFIEKVAEAHDCDVEEVFKLAGWTNKMFVKASLMPHHIRITNIKIERLQDIRDEDCFREGIKYACPIDSPEYTPEYTTFEGCSHIFDEPRGAFSTLIDKVSGRGTWMRNPWVVAYEFIKVD